MPRLSVTIPLLATYTCEVEVDSTSPEDLALAVELAIATWQDDPDCDLDEGSLVHASALPPGISILEDE